MSGDKVHSPEATSDYDESYDSAESDFLSIVPEDQRVSGDWIPVSNQMVLTFM